MIVWGLLIISATILTSIVADDKSYHKMTNTQGLIKCYGNNMSLGNSAVMWHIIGNGTFDKDPVTVTTRADTEGNFVNVSSTATVLQRDVVVACSIGEATVKLYPLGKS